MTASGLPGGATSKQRDGFAGAVLAGAEPVFAAAWRCLSATRGRVHIGDSETRFVPATCEDNKPRLTDAVMSPQATPRKADTVSKP